ncbi:MAG: endonuclease/exonuclease/phosphatase family protein [Candidatus Latescibacterota bacterium]|nr:endonuclease [Gemmatimonadaceae bacterium]MEC8992705.1 endonuclease/exonuclease/phosphatase family protein [Candidatus Latescibacterota bacterium]
MNTLKILTCNIRYYGANDGQNDWTHRRDFCADVIAAQAADVVCMQEMWAQQRADLVARLPEYGHFGMLDEPVDGQPVNTIFYRTDAFTLLDAGGYWLSATPHVSGSSSWDSACVRLANWVMLAPRGGGTRIRVLNTHLDHVSQPAREGQASLLVEDAQAYGDSLVQVLTGDLNCDESNPAIDALCKGGWQDSYEAVHGTSDPGLTYHAFKGPHYSPEVRVGKMDWIFLRGAATATDAQILDEARDGKYPSDHYFVSAVINLASSR